MVAHCPVLDFGDGFGVARPLWLRLFGPNGPTTIQELGDAFLAAPIGVRAGEGRVFQHLARIVDRADPPARDLQALPAPAPVAREQTSLAAAVMTGHDVAAATASTPEWTPPAIEAAATAGGPIPERDAANVTGDETGPVAILHLDGVISPFIGVQHSPFALVDPAQHYVLSGDLQTGLVIDSRTKTLLPGGPRDHPDFGAGPNDTMELDGDYSAGLVLDTPDYVEQIIARAGNDYNLISDDASIAAGGTLIVNAMPLGDSNHMIYDGSAETDGRFVFFGSQAADIFLGGDGDDRLHGLGGADIFAFTTALGAGNVDTIVGFVAGTDKIGLDDAIFTAIGGTLGAGAFVIGTQAGDADDRIIYSSASGALLYDADGNGAGAAVQFATLSTGLALTASDFIMI